jgi:hypothetical protein
MKLEPLTETEKKILWEAEDIRYFRRWDVRFMRKYPQTSAVLALVIMSLLAVLLIWGYIMLGGAIES